MKSFWKYVLALYPLVAFAACHNGEQPIFDNGSFIFDTTIIAGDADYYAKPVIITGHITNRDIYPETKEICISLPFYDRVDRKQTSQIWEDDSFSFEFFPYALRDISMSPWVDRFLVSPGDSIHIELDFSDFNNVTFSGRGSENNLKLNAFHMRYYLGDWPSFSETVDFNGSPKQQYETAVEYKKALDTMLDGYMSRFNDFVENEHPSEELMTFCRQEIEADYYSNLASQLCLYQNIIGEDVSQLFNIRDVEHLFSGDCFNSRLFTLAANINGWILDSVSMEQRLTFSKSIPVYADFLKESTENGLLLQMILSKLFESMLEENNVDDFEENFSLFNKNVTFPLLKLSVRDKYVEKRAFRDNPRILSEAILNGDKAKDGVSTFNKENDGLKLLRDVIVKSDGYVVYISIGASWCSGTIQEMPFQLQLAEIYNGKPLRIVNFYLNEGINSVDAITGIEDYYLTDEQRIGLDPIFHTGRGIPFYILINKDGNIVDFGLHLRPSMDNTTRTIDSYLK